MTSGQFTTFPISSIYVDREARQRRELTGIQELAWSIESVGLLNPPIIERDGKLRAGERRYTACALLGWTHIPVQFTDELDEQQLQLIELEENVRRVNLSWQDHTAAVKSYHDIQLSRDPTWNLDRTGAALHMARNTVGEMLGVAEEISKGNRQIAEAPKYSVAKNIVVRKRARASATAIEAIINPSATQVKTAPLLHADFTAWAPQYIGPKFNFIHCDFPYGVNADSHDQGAAAEMGGYADTFSVYETLLQSLALSMSNVVADSAHIMFWFSMDYYQYTKEALEAMGWRVNPFPLIWHKLDNTGILPDPQRGPRRIYETAFFGSRSDRLIVRAVSNVVSAPVTKITHMSEKSQPMLRKFFEMLVDENTTMLDPTCGSANAVKIAEAAGAKRVLGLERDEEFFNRAKEAYYVDDL